jgi:hypothetical protein
MYCHVCQGVVEEHTPRVKFEGHLDYLCAFHMVTVADVELEDVWDIKRVPISEIPGNGNQAVYSCCLSDNGFTSLYLVVDPTWDAHILSGGHYEALPSPKREYSRSDFTAFAVYIKQVDKQLGNALCQLISGFCR